MKQVGGLWMPDGERHLETHFKINPSFNGLPTYQFHKYALAFPNFLNFRHAVDVGAHIGTWSRVMARCFSKVTAFEPVPELADCFDKNVPQDDGCEVTLHRLALGDKARSLRISTKIKTVENDATTLLFNVADTGVEVPCLRLDSFEFDDVDFIKIDCEGYELYVVNGAADTIRRCRPVVLVEQKPKLAWRYGVASGKVVQELREMGMILKFANNDDYCLTWPL